MKIPKAQLPCSIVGNIFLSCPFSQPLVTGKYGRGCMLDIKCSAMS